MEGNVINIVVCSPLTFYRDLAGEDHLICCYSNILSFMAGYKIPGLKKTEK
jgi:hypothetical protein